MRSSAYLINNSRGPVVDQKALTAALEDGAIAGAALDVLEDERPDQRNPSSTCPTSSPSRTSAPPPRKPDGPCAASPSKTSSTSSKAACPRHRQPRGTRLARRRPSPPLPTTLRPPPAARYPAPADRTTQEEPPMADPGMITTLDEFEAEYRKGIGQPLPHRWSIEASVDNIRRWGDGVGDYNPLWRDPPTPPRATSAWSPRPPPSSTPAPSASAPPKTAQSTPPVSPPPTSP